MRAAAYGRPTKIFFVFSLCLGAFVAEFCFHFEKNLSLDLLSLFILEYCYLPELAIIPRRNMDIHRAHARHGLANEHRAYTLEIVERRVQEYVELVAEPFEQ